LPLQFLAAWLAVWLGRVLQEQIDYLKTENLILREKAGPKRVTRIMGALKNLGHQIGRNTIKRILLENRIDPVPERGRRTS
jgi:hypothetical protein